MKTKIVLAAALAAGVLSTPAFADYWVVRESPSAQCKIVTTKPETKVTIVGNTMYKTREEATKEMTTACK
jgi:hypothetical protein